MGRETLAIGLPLLLCFGIGLKRRGYRGDVAAAKTVSVLFCSGFHDSILIHEIDVDGKKVVAITIIGLAGNKNIEKVLMHGWVDSLSEWSIGEVPRESGSRTANKW